LLFFENSQLLKWEMYERILAQGKMAARTAAIGMAAFNFTKKCLRQKTVSTAKKYVLHVNSCGKM